MHLCGYTSDQRDECNHLIHPYKCACVYFTPLHTTSVEISIQFEMFASVTDTTHITYYTHRRQNSPPPLADADMVQCISGKRQSIYAVRNSKIQLPADYHEDTGYLHLWNHAHMQFLQHVPTPRKTAETLYIFLSAYVEAATIPLLLVYACARIRHTRYFQLVQMQPPQYLHRSRPEFFETMHRAPSYMNANIAFLRIRER